MKKNEHHNRAFELAMKPVKFADFKRCVLYWMDQFGLHDWRALFEVEKKDKGSIATVYCTVDARIARFVLYTDSRSVMPADRVALHEVLHVLLSDVIYEAVKHEDYEHPTIVRHEHAAMERLMRVIRGRAEG